MGADILGNVAACLSWPLHHTSRWAEQNFLVILDRCYPAIWCHLSLWRNGEESVVQRLWWSDCQIWSHQGYHNKEGKKSVIHHQPYHHECQGGMGNKHQHVQKETKTRHSETLYIWYIHSGRKVDSKIVLASQLAIKIYLSGPIYIAIHFI